MYSNPGADVFIAAVAGTLIFFGIIFLIILVLVTIINWKILVKMGDEGWKSLIPVYNTWSICEGIGLCPHWAWITVVATTVLSNVPFLGPLAASAATLYFSVIYCISLSRAFGKDDGFAVLLFFFFPIVGFLLVKNDYIGLDPCHDIVFDDWIKWDSGVRVQEAEVVEEDKKEESESEPKEKTIKYCTNCGKKIGNDSKFCPSCGKQVN